MAHRQVTPGKLTGQRVAFAGQWASLSRSEAENLVTTHGGTLEPRVTESTAFLVIGAGRLPIRKSGRPSRNLQRAQLLRRRGCAVEIISEEDFLSRLGLSEAANRIRRRLSVGELSEMLRIPGPRIRSWVRSGLLQPAETQQGVGYFDFHQVAGVKTLSVLFERGVTPERIQRTLRQLHDCMPSLTDPLAHLETREFAGQFLLRRDDGRLVDAGGQLYFDFEENDGPAILGLRTGPRTAEEWFRRGVELEEGGDLQDAAHAYRQAALAGGPDVQVCFNLGNVLYALGKKAEAAERFRQAVEIEGSFAEAWNNLGIVHTELGEHDEAVAAFRKAIDANPHYGDPHYNLADLLQQLGRVTEAQHHWQMYLRFDGQSPWAMTAREHMKKRRSR